MNSPVDAELKQLHIAAMNLYNRETAYLHSNPTSIVSINAVNFLAGQATTFADSALFLMEDARQPLNAPAALLRTCLEAQARANHIIAVVGKEREQRANELQQLMHVGHDYYVTMSIQMTKDFAPNASNSLPRNIPYLPHIKRLTDSIDTSKLKTLEKQYKLLGQNWSYSKVIGRKELLDPVWQNRSEAQRLQPELYVRYIQLCAFVHSDPASLKLAQLLTPLSVAYTAVMAEIVALLCFFVALGKEKDQDLFNLKKRFIAFDPNEKILPKKDLPPI
jgi:hypothetical protein